MNRPPLEVADIVRAPPVKRQDSMGYQGRSPWLVSILPMVVSAGRVNSRATIANAFSVPSVVASGLRVVPGTGLPFRGEVDLGSSANCESEQRAFCRIATSRAMEVWLDICELQDGNPAVGRK